MDNAALDRFMLQVGGVLLCDWSAMLCVLCDWSAKGSEPRSTNKLANKSS